MIDENIFESLREKIGLLKEYRDEAFRISDAVTTIESEISLIDEALPNPSSLSQIKDKEERDRLRKAEDLLKEAYGLIDELLGPPDEFGEYETTQAYMPQARGTTGQSVSFQEMLEKFPIGGKGTTKS